ncbi:chitin synthase, class II, partial [Aureobasidium melanogenum]
MFTSSAQYFGMLPSYICTLQIFAFCNAHDISWGTKGDNTVSTDLGAAKASKGGTVELEMPSEQLDIDSGYDTALRNLRDRVEVIEPPPSAAQQQEDYYRGVRTYMVTVWMSTNAILAMAVSGAYGETGIANNVYLKFILWAVAVLALFRAIGSSTFLLINAIHSIMEGKLKFSDRSSTGSKTASRRRYGWRSKIPSFSFLNGSGTWISDKAGNATVGVKRLFNK